MYQVSGSMTPEELLAAGRLGMTYCDCFPCSTGGISVQTFIHPKCDALRFARVYRKGQEDMRERAKKVCAKAENDHADSGAEPWRVAQECHDLISALQIEETETKSDKQGHVHKEREVSGE